MPARKLGRLNLPPLSVLVSCFAPWSLTDRMTTSAQGFPFTSMIEPLIDPVWAAARGASTLDSAATRIVASAHELRKRFMLHSPFFTREPCPESPGHVRPIISLTRPDSKLSARQKRFAGRGWAPAPRLPRRRGAAAGSYRRRRRQYLRSGSTTRLDAAPHPVPCPAG